MHKLKNGKCIYCKETIRRHDVMRATVKVGQGSTGQGVYKEAHLKCQQSA